MEKKRYIMPVVKSVKIQGQECLLAVSSKDLNSYFDPEDVDPSQVDEKGNIFGL